MWVLSVEDLAKRQDTFRHNDLDTLAVRGVSQDEGDDGDVSQYRGCTWQSICKTAYSVSTNSFMPFVEEKTELQWKPWRLLRETESCGNMRNHKTDISTFDN